MDKTSSEYKSLVNAISCGILFFTAIVIFIAFVKTEIPYLLFFVGWLLRSSIIRGQFSDQPARNNHFIVKIVAWPILLLADAGIYLCSGRRYWREIRNISNAAIFGVSEES